MGQMLIGHVDLQHGRQHNGPHMDIRPRSRDVAFSLAEIADQAACLEYIAL